MTRGPDSTSDHEGWVSLFARGIVEQLALPPHVGRAVKQAVRLHDIGMRLLPAELLSKPGQLTPYEFEVVQRHARLSEQIARQVATHHDIAVIIRAHHERLDGTGYPDGLSGRNIPLGARIIAVADAFDALTSSRPYRPARSWTAALEEIEDAAGAQHDPMLVAALSAWLDQFADSLRAREGLWVPPK